MSIVMFRDSDDSDGPGRTGQAVCIDLRRWRSFHDGWLVRYDDTSEMSWAMVSPWAMVVPWAMGVVKNKFPRDLRDPISFDAG